MSGPLCANSYTTHLTYLFFSSSLTCIWHLTRCPSCRKKNVVAQGNFLFDMLLGLTCAATAFQPEMSAFLKITVSLFGRVYGYVSVDPAGSTVPFTRTLPG